VPTQPLVIRWRLALRDDDGPSRSAKLFGLMLSTYSDNKTGASFAGLPTLARNCGFSVDTARRAQHELWKSGYLDLTRRPGLTSISTLVLPLARVQGVRGRRPLARSPITPSTGATLTLRTQQGGAANAARRLLLWTTALAAASAFP